MIDSDDGGDDDDYDDVDDDDDDDGDDDDDDDDDDFWLFDDFRLFSTLFRHYHQIRFQKLRIIVPCWPDKYAHLRREENDDGYHVWRWMVMDGDDHEGHANQDDLGDAYYYLAHY